MKTILVSGASGVVGYGTLKSLRRAPQGKFRLIGTSIHEDSVAPAFCDIFEKAVPTNDAGYMDWLKNIIKKHNVDLAIPGIEIDMQTWSEQREEIQSGGTKILLNTPELVKLCRDKWSFFEKIGGEGNPLAIPTRLSGTYDEIVKEFGLPFLLKPRAGFASKGIVYVDNKALFDQHMDQIGKNLMIQPVIGTKHEEYTISGFFNADSKLCCHISLRRTLSKEGFTETAWVTHVDGAEEAMISLAKILKPIGPTNFQFRLSEGNLKLLEINPRISSATSIRTAFGYNESLMAVDYLFDGIPPEQPVIKSGHAVRYTEEQVFYDRDHL